MRHGRSRLNGQSIAVTGAFLFLMLTVFGCGTPSTRTPQGAEIVRDLQVYTVRSEGVADEVEAPGSVVASATAQVAARAMGTVVQLAVREGDTVKRGQLLVLLDARELAARHRAAQAAQDEASAAREEATRAVAAAQAQTDLASKTYERFVYLREQKSVSPQEFDEVEAKHRAALAALEQSKARHQQAEAMHARAESEARAAQAVAGYARVTAPFDGVVSRRSVEAGSMVSPGMPLLVVEDNSRYRIEVAVAASDAAPLIRGAAPIRRGTSARVRLDALPEKEFLAKVVELEGGADPASHTVRVKIELPRDPTIRSGLFGRAWFRRGERHAVVLPRTAIVERGQLRGLYVVDAGQVAHWRLVTLGRTIAGRVEILSGLDEGERVVLAPGDRPLGGKRIAGPSVSRNEAGASERMEAER